MRKVASAGLVVAMALGACGGAGSPSAPPVEAAPAATEAPAPAGATATPAVTPGSDYQDDYGY